MRQIQNTSDQKTRRSTLLHYWNNGHPYLSDITRMTKISTRTIKYIIVKVKERLSIKVEVDDLAR